MHNLNEDKGPQASAESLHDLLKQMAQYCIGQEEALTLCLGACLVGGHVLIEDIPGVGKTNMAKTMAQGLSVAFKRVQFTPDLMPSDILGVSIYNQQTQRFDFRQGPIFTNIFMADEINRSSPKTQSALLEAMEEGQVSTDGYAFDLPQPFMVIATQNPIEFEGTFPLPEAQMDRFMIQVHLGYPSPHSELAIYKKESGLSSADPITPLTEACYSELRQAVDSVHISEALLTYIQQLAFQSRNHEHVFYGISPRAGIALVKMAKFWAFKSGRTFVVPEDIKSVAPSVMRHRLIMKPEALYHQHTVLSVIEQLLKGVAVPKGSFDHER